MKIRLPELPMNPLGAAILGVGNAFGMYLTLRFGFNGDPLGSAIAGAIVGMLCFGILISEVK